MHIGFLFYLLFFNILLSTGISLQGLVNILVNYLSTQTAVLLTLFTENSTIDQNLKLVTILMFIITLILARNIEILVCVFLRPSRLCNCYQMLTLFRDSCLTHLLKTDFENSLASPKRFVLIGKWQKPENVIEIYRENCQCLSSFQKQQSWCIFLDSLGKTKYQPTWKKIEPEQLAKRNEI